jgi:hypothetical protein
MQGELLDLEPQAEDELLRGIGMSEEDINHLIHDGCAISSMAESTANPDYGYDDVRSIVDDWCYDPDSPFDETPLTPDGQPDAVQILMSMFDWVGEFQVFSLKRGQRVPFTNARSHSTTVLLGLFHIHCKMPSLLHGRPSEATDLSCAISTVRSPALASVFAYGYQCDRGQLSDIVDAALREECLEDRGADDTLVVQSADWLIKVRSAMVPYRNERSFGEYDSTQITMPFHPTSDTLVLEKAVLIGHHLSQRVKSPGRVRLDRSIYSSDGYLNCTQRLQKFSMRIQTRYDSTKDNPIDMRRFLLFCDALFKCIVRTVDGMSCTTPHRFWSSARYHLEDLASLGMRAGAAAAMQLHHHILTDTLRANQKPVLSDMPWDMAEYLLKNHVLHGTFANYRRTVLKAPTSITNERMRFLYVDRVPRSGQEITVNRLDVFMDSALLPPYREYATRVFTAYRDDAYNPSATQLTPQKLGALRHAEALGMTEQPFDATDFFEIGHEHLGTRHVLHYLQSSNKAICTMRAVCKTYADLFKDYVFRPVVEFDGDTNRSGVHRGSFESLRGAPPRDVRPTNKPQTLHVYFARKALRVDTETGDVTEWWQYINPALTRIGCNAIVVTCETEPDASGSAICFPAAQAGTRNGRFAAESRQSHWEQANHETGHHIQPESLPTESVYSIHPGARWNERLRSANANSKIVCVWDRKFDHKWKTSTRRVAVSQSITMSAKCARTSASLCLEKTDPLRAVRFRVAFGDVPQSLARLQAAGEDDIVPFDASEVAAFRECVSASSDYFYASSISLDPESVAKRAEKRKVRTENERLERRSAAAARRQ